MEFLVEHPFCQWFISKYGLDEDEVIRNHGWFEVNPEMGIDFIDPNYRGMARVPEANQIHHKRGRIGDLLTNKELFMAVSPRGHDHIHHFTKESYERGWMLQR